MTRLLVTLVLMCLFAGAVFCQEKTVSEPEHVLVSVDAKDQDVREALRTVFTEAKASFTLHPDVQGKVNLSLRDIPLSQALNKILGQANAVYVLDSGIYNVIPRIRLSDPNEPLAEGGIRIVDVEVAEALKRLPGHEIVVIEPGVTGPVTFVGAYQEGSSLNEIARQLDARVLRTDSGYRLVPKNTLRKRISSVRYSDGDLRKIVTDLLNQAGVDYIVSGGIVGRTTVNLSETDVQSALEAVLQPIGGKITLRRGVFIVSAK